MDARLTVDAAHIRFMTVPGAHLAVSLGADGDGKAELLLFGNRAGLLSLANVVLWLRAVASRRELLSFGELPFVEPKGPIALHIRIGADDATGSHGAVRKLDRGADFEWVIPEEDLQHVGLSIHHVAANPEYEYERLALEAESAAGIQVRMTDAGEWL
jgi:hypothetical protein